MQIKQITCALIKKKKKNNISTLNGGSLKLEDKFSYLRSSVLSTENDINTRLTNAQTAINRLFVIWKSDLSDEINRNFYPSSGRVHITIRMHHMDTD